MKVRFGARWSVNLSIVGVVVAAFASPTAAGAVTASPAWRITSVAEPSSFSSTHIAACEGSPTSSPGQSVSSPCDSYRVIARNVGASASSASEPLLITDAIPAVGVEAVYALLEEQQAGGGVATSECTLLPVRCEYAGPVPPGGELIVTINVRVLPSAPAEVLNSATIQGGGLAQAVGTSEPTTKANAINGATPPFAIEGFDFRVDGLDGAPDIQAGDHPYAVTTSFHTPSVTRFDSSEARYQRFPVQRIRNLIVDLPSGFLGDPQAVPRCPLTAIREDVTNSFTTTGCPTASRVGTVTFEANGKFHPSNVFSSDQSSIYNMVPEAGYPAEFAFSYLGNPIFMYVTVLPSASGYGLRVAVPGLLAVPVEGVSLTFFGDPAQQDGGATASMAFLTNPVACAGPGPLAAKIELDSWEEPGRWVSAQSPAYSEVTGCDMLQFQPMIAVAPEVTQVDTPSGYEVDVKVPQTPNVAPVVATPELKGATIALPEGVAISPGAVDGLTACQERGREGIELGAKDSLGHIPEEGEEAGAGGLPRATPGHCPAASQIGTVQVVTSLLPDELHGHVYLARPRCGGDGQPACQPADATNGNLYSLYLEVEGDGVVIKLKGEVSANPSTGALTARFDENPQLPFDELRVELKGGPRAPLANPQPCGTFTTTSDLTPWSAPFTLDATPSSSFAVGGCGDSMPFAPQFIAGTVTPMADGFSPFTLTFARRDGEQNLSGISVSTPPGLLGMLSQVNLCPEPQASQGMCRPQSLIGHAQVAVGSGSHPFWEQGTVYLTGPYKGQPFGLSIVVPAVAGPFNLGNVIVRAAIHIDPHTSALTVTSDPLPRIIDGVPLRIKTVNVSIDKPGFIFNPTNCSQQQITGTVTGALPDGTRGLSVGVSSPFAVAGCKNLPFNPKFTALAQAKTSKANGVYLHVKVVSGPGQANIAKVKVDLPKQLPSRLTTLQKACLAAVFEANPAACPTGSVVGTGTAVTPVLKNILTGPAYLVSHGGAAFPDLEIVLQGEGITLDLVGNTDIKKGITSSTFKAVPDAPISTFDLVLSEGPHSVLAAYLPVKAKGSMCGQSLSMPTAITGQNGAVVKQTTKIAVSGCAKAKKKTKKAKKGSKASAKHGKAGKK